VHVSLQKCKLLLAKVNSYINPIIGSRIYLAGTAASCFSRFTESGSHLELFTTDNN
jgi:hypothetical protein